ncbi:MAG: response regulator transcription factor [Anaerolineae bacterium]|jgi:DNA-binding response OmpR family regulator|nr:response regulator transcription factor [Anaerolineae bacterium]
MPGHESRQLIAVDDDRGLLRLLNDTFESEGYDIETFCDPVQALRYVRKRGLPHLALIDLQLPEMHGFALSAELKSMGDIPIVFITGEDEPQMAVAGLVQYAEDYVRKPFNIGELVARVRRVLSRFSDSVYTQTSVTKIDNWLSVDLANQRLWRGKQPVILTPIEANLLHILLRHAGDTVTSDTLLMRVWPYQDVYADTLRVHMHRLRRKTEPDFRRPTYIQTERGVGYRFKID